MSVITSFLCCAWFQEESDDEDDDDDDEEPLKSPSKEGIPPVEADLKLEDAPADIDVLLDVAEPESNLGTGLQPHHIHSILFHCTMFTLYGSFCDVTGIIGGPDDDLTLRASLYGVLFQSYADRGEWEAGLRAMDKAIADMPRTNHRLLIYKHLVVIKAKLGLNVGLSIQKFKVRITHPPFSFLLLHLFTFSLVLIHLFTAILT